MKKISYLIVLLAISLSACVEEETAKISVQNLVHNAYIENVGFYKHTISYSLFPGTSSSKYSISDTKENWPKVSQLEFYMVRDSRRVYLKTKYAYRLDVDDDLLVIIADTTEVVSPFGKKSGKLGDYTD